MAFLIDTHKYNVITICPYCGRALEHVIVRGITGCTNCNRVIDSSPFHKMMSGSWLVRRKNIIEPQVLIEQYGYSLEDANFLIEQIWDNSCSHEDFLEICKARIDSLKTPVYN